MGATICNNYVAKVGLVHGELNIAVIFAMDIGSRVSNAGLGCKDTGSGSRGDDSLHGAYTSGYKGSD